MNRRVMIIGAGLAGLTAGIHLQEKGYDTEIFELADWAGGMFTSWVRKGFRFDGCIHWMVGSKKGTAINKLYREIDLVNDDTEMYNSPSFQFEFDGKIHEVPLTMKEFREYLHSLSAEDKDIINELCDDMETMAATDLVMGLPKGIFAMSKFVVKNFGFIKMAGKYLNMTMEEYVQSYKSDEIRKILLLFLPAEFSVQALIMMLGTRMSGNAGYPLGGSLEAEKRIEAKYIHLGGKIHFKSKVDEIIIENGKATGIKSKGEIYSADAVIAACDAYDTLKNMLGGHYEHGQLEELLDKAPVFASEILVSYGLSKPLGIPPFLHVERSIDIDKEIQINSFAVRSFDFDKTAAPEGKSSVMVIMEGSYEYWYYLRQSDSKAYKAQKKLLAEKVADVLEIYYPGFKDSVEVTDVATPATYIRIANLYKGSFEGFLPTPTLLKTRIKYTIPGIKNLVLCGQWLHPGGGICVAVASGKRASEMIKKLVKE